MEVFLQKEHRNFSAHKKNIGAVISCPRIADTNFTDTRIFLIIMRRGPLRTGSRNRNLIMLCLPVLRSWPPSKGVPKPQPGKVPKKCFAKCRSETEKCSALRAYVEVA